MSTISTHLRNFKEPTKDQLTQLFFALPSSVNGGVDAHGLANGSVAADAVAQSEKEKGGGGSAEKEKEKEKEKGQERRASGGVSETELEKMEINAVLSLGVQGEEDSYVSDSDCHFVDVCKVDAVRGLLGWTRPLPLS